MKYEAYEAQRDLLVKNLDSSINELDNIIQYENEAKESMRTYAEAKCDEYITNLDVKAFCDSVHKEYNKKTLFGGLSLILDEKIRNTEFQEERTRDITPEVMINMCHAAKEDAIQNVQGVESFSAVLRYMEAYNELFGDKNEKVDKNEKIMSLVFIPEPAETSEDYFSAAEAYAAAIISVENDGKDTGIESDCKKIMEKINKGISFAEKSTDMNTFSEQLKSLSESINEISSCAKNNKTKQNLKIIGDMCVDKLKGLHDVHRELTAAM